MTAPFPQAVRRTAFAGMPVAVELHVRPLSVDFQTRASVPVMPRSAPLPRAATREREAGPVNVTRVQEPGDVLSKSTFVFVKTRNRPVEAAVEESRGSRLTSLFRELLSFMHPGNKTIAKSPNDTIERFVKIFI